MRFLAAIVTFALAAAVTASSATTSDSSQLAQRAPQASCNGQPCRDTICIGPGCHCNLNYVSQDVTFVCIAVLMILTQNDKCSEFGG